jgi:Uma2 family endonuclease
MVSGDSVEEEPMTTAPHLIELDLIDKLHLLDRDDLTVDDIADLPEDLRYELIDGRLVLPSPTGLHQILGVEIVLALRPGCPPSHAPVPDLSLKIDRRNEPRPDIVVIRRDALRRSPAPVKQALLAVEVISPDSHHRDMYAKSKIYAAAGVENYWVIDPTFAHGLVLTEFRPGENGAYEIVTSTSKMFTTEVPYPITIDLPALTAMRDGLLPPPEP